MPDADPIELEVFRHLFAAVAEEMGERLMRSAYSPNIKERRDFSCALFDASGEMLAQAAHIPVHLGSTPMAVQAVIDAFGLARAHFQGEGRGEGGVNKPIVLNDQRSDCETIYILNDPYAGGTHLPDITVVRPLVLPGDDRPAFYLANRAHHADVGGISPGSLPISQHIDDEGLRITPRVLDEDTIDWIANASRTPDERRGDLRAQLAALHVGAERLRTMAQRYGHETLTQRGRELLAYTERIVENFIAELPDGTYTFDDVLDDDGFGTTHIAIRCALRIAGSRAQVDFTHSADQVAGPVNAVRAIALSAVNYCFRCLLPSDLPSNGGVMRPIDVLTRPGSVVDAQYPAPVAGGNVETSQRLVDVVFGALANVLPKRVPAASCGSMNNLTLGGIDPRPGMHRRPFAYYETLAGGGGASSEHDGADALHTHMTNTLNTPIEAFEHAYPARIVRYAVRQHSGGAGRHRGGDGIIRSYQFDVPVTATLLTERRVSQPYGLSDGEPGVPGRNTLTDIDGNTLDLPAKTSVDIHPGQTLTIQTPGGGGFGSA